MSVDVYIYVRDIYIYIYVYVYNVYIYIHIFTYTPVVYVSWLSIWNHEVPLF